MSRAAARSGKDEVPPYVTERGLLDFTPIVAICFQQHYRTGESFISSVPAAFFSGYCTPHNTLKIVSLDSMERIFRDYKKHSKTEIRSPELDTFKRSFLNEHYQLYSQACAKPTSLLKIVDTCTNASGLTIEGRWNRMLKESKELSTSSLSDDLNGLHLAALPAMDMSKLLHVINDKRNLGPDLIDEEMYREMQRAETDRFECRFHCYERMR